MDYHSAVKKNKLLIHSAAWLDLQSMISEGGEAQRLYTVGFHLYKILDTEKLNSWKVSLWFLGSGMGGGKTAKGPKGAFGDENVLYLDCRNGFTQLDTFIKAHQLYSQNW